MNRVECSRSAKMVHMALGKEEFVAHEQKPHQKLLAKQVILNSDSRIQVTTAYNRLQHLELTF